MEFDVLFIEILKLEKFRKNKLSLRLVETGARIVLLGVEVEKGPSSLRVLKTVPYFPLARTLSHGARADLGSENRS